MEIIPRVCNAVLEYWQGEEFDYMTNIEQEIYQLASVETLLQFPSTIDQHALKVQKCKQLLRKCNVDSSVYKTIIEHAPAEHINDLINFCMNELRVRYKVTSQHLNIAHKRNLLDVVKHFNICNPNWLSCPNWHSSFSETLILQGNTCNEDILRYILATDPLRKDEKLYAIANSRPIVLKCLLETVPEQDRLSKLKKYNFFSLALCIEVVDVMLLMVPETASFIDEEGNTLLHLIVKHAMSNTLVAKILDRLNCNVNATNNKKETPLHICKYQPVFELLVNRGASLSAQNDLLETPLMIVAKTAKLYSQYGIYVAEDFLSQVDVKGQNVLFHWANNQVTKSNSDKQMFHNLMPQYDFDIITLSVVCGDTKLNKLLLQPNAENVSPLQLLIPVFAKYEGILSTCISKLGLNLRYDTTCMDTFQLLLKHLPTLNTLKSYLYGSVYANSDDAATTPFHALLGTPYLNRTFADIEWLQSICTNCNLTTTIFIDGTESTPLSTAISNSRINDSLIEKLLSFSAPMPSGQSALVALMKHGRPLVKWYDVSRVTQEEFFLILSQNKDLNNAAIKTKCNTFSDQQIITSVLTMQMGVAIPFRAWCSQCSVAMLNWILDKFATSHGTQIMQVMIQQDAITLDTGFHLLIRSFTLVGQQKVVQDMVARFVQLNGYTSTVLNVQNKLGKTVLHLAAEQFMGTMAKWLVQQGADRAITDTSNKRAADYIQSDDKLHRALMPKQNKRKAESAPAGKPAKKPRKK